MVGVYDASYRTINSRPVIYLFCRDNDRKKIVKKITDFKPYFYIEPELLQKSKFPGIIKIESAKQTTIYGKPVMKCTMNKPSDSYHMRQHYQMVDKDYNKKIFESDVLFELRYCIDNVNSDSNINYRVGSIDIETDCSQGFPDAENPVEPIVCISVHDNYTNKIRTLAFREDLQPSKNDDIKIFNSEVQMLESFIKYIKSLDLDIMTAWNVGFDINYLLARFKRLGINYQQLSNVTDKLDVYSTNLLVKEKKDYNEVEILGIVIFDMLKGYKKLHFGEMESYSLNNVAYVELGEEKEKVYNTGEVWRKDIDKLISYNRKDVDLLVRINEKCKIISILDNIKCFAGVRNINDVFFASRIHETRIMRHYKDIYAFPNKEEFREKTEQDRIVGAFVKEPVPGIYSNVIVLDFASLYPSMIYTFNLSREMIDETGKQGSLINGIYIKQSPKGIMPSMIMELIKLKNDMKKQVEGTGQSASDKMFAIKTFINSCYGIQVLSSFRLFDKRVAQNITWLGQQFIKNVIDIVEKEYGYVVRYGDTDSSFIEISDVKDNDELIKKGYELQKHINDRIPSIIERLGGDAKGSNVKIELDKVFEKIIFQCATDETKGAKKRYAGTIIFQDGKQCRKLKIVGMSARRSDVCKVSKDIQAKLIEMILSGSDKQACHDYIKQIVDDLYDNKYDVEDISLPVKLNADIEDYKVQNSPKIRGIKFSNKYLGTHFSSGTKFKMLYVKHINTDVVCFDDKEQIKDMKINWSIMFDKIVFQKIKQIFYTLQWQKTYEQLVLYSECKANNQKSLFAF